ncbi:hypothetical protein JTE90_020934 [Oedothorax gibbosus]|uniref:Uncharacterized protein n=1 Tax=Oedothorax gibbosus TaxID=931172 RepID=A0AAV6VPJ9_9ARAC|nr:hypothetical protein JTE90_020934 [Oedothorax gibbosus]
MRASERWWVASRVGLHNSRVSRAQKMVGILESVYITVEVSRASEDGGWLLESVYITVEVSRSFRKMVGGFSSRFT